MSTDILDQELREAMQGALELRALRVSDNPRAAVEKRVAERRRRRVALRIGACATAIALVAMSAYVALDRRAESNPRVTTRPANTRPAAPTISDLSGVKQLPAPPLEIRAHPAIIEAKGQVVVWGGSTDTNDGQFPSPARVFSDGAVYSIAAGRWHLMAPAPFVNEAPSATVGSLSPHATLGAATDDGVLLVYGRNVALYDPAGDTWRRLDDAPRTVGDLVTTGTTAISYSANARLDLETGRWQDLPIAPATIGNPTTAWTGSEMIVIGAPGDRSAETNGIAYNPSSDTWRSLAHRSPVNSQALSADWDGRRVVVVSYDLDAFAYDPSADTWTTLPRVPARHGEFGPQLRSVGGRSVAFMVSGIYVLDRDDRWVPLPYGPIPLIVNTTRPSESSPAQPRLYLWGVQDASTNVFAVADPKRMIIQPPRVQVGIGTFSSQPGDRLVSVTRTDQRAPGDPDFVSVTIAEAGGGTCTIVSGNVAQPDPTTLDSVTMQNDRTPTTWYLSANRATLTTVPTSTDTFQVQCDRPGRTFAIAESAAFLYRGTR